MTAELNYPFKRLKVLRIQAVQFANEDVQWMRDGEGDIAALDSHGALTPAGTGAKAQLKSRFQIKSTV